MLRSIFTASAILFAALNVSVAGAGELPRVAVFNFELIDTSLDGQVLGENKDEQARLGVISRQLRGWVERDGHLALADIAPVEAEARGNNLTACGGCVPKMAQKVNAAYAITGTVQKVSNLILNINLYVHDVASKKVVASASADIRGNNDKSWTRGLDWLMQHRLAGILTKITAQ